MPEIFAAPLDTFSEAGATTSEEWFTDVFASCSETCSSLTKRNGFAGASAFKDAIGQMPESAFKNLPPPDPNTWYSKLFVELQHLAAIFQSIFAFFQAVGSMVYVALILGSLIALYVFKKVPTESKAAPIVYEVTHSGTLKVCLSDMRASASGDTGRDVSEQSHEQSGQPGGANSGQPPNEPRTTPRSQSRGGANSSQAS
jgi:hypothetical protein